MATINLDLLSDEDYKAYTEKRYADLSPDAQKYLSGEGFGTAETLVESAGQGFSSSLRGLVGLLPENDFISVDKEADLEAERRSRMMLETNPLAGWGGLLVGSALDPVTLPAALLKPLTIGGAAATGALRGSAAGAFGGVLEPVYEEMGDSRVMNILGGAGLGAGLGGLIGKMFGRSTPKAATEAETEAAKIIDSPDPVKAVEDAAATEESTVVKAMEPAIPESAVFNKEKGVFETFSEETPTVDFNLPRQLAGAKSRFNQFPVTFSNDIDKALYVVGNSTSKSKSHDAYVDWLARTLDLDEAGVKAAARSTRSELVKALGRTAPDADGRLVATPSTFSQTVTQKLTAPRQVAAPVKPTVTIKDGLDEKDLALLEKAGVKVIVGRNGTLVVQDLFAPKNANMMSNATFLQRMEAAGIGIDLPAYRKRTRAEVQARREQEAAAMGRGAGDQPAVTNQSQQFWAKQEPVNREQWTTPPAGRAEQATPTEQLQTGAPRDTSMGAASTRPATLYGESLTPKELKVIPKIELANRAMSMSLEDFVKLVPKKELGDLRKLYPDDAALEAYLKAGQEKLKNILKNNNNIVEWMVKKSKLSTPLSADEVAAFTPFYYRAMAAREAVLQKALEHRRAGGSFESAEGAKLVEDLMYYTGIALFKKESGSKAGRALNAFNLFSQKNATGQRLKNMFPGVAC